MIEAVRCGRRCAGWFDIFIHVYTSTALGHEVQALTYCHGEQSTPRGGGSAAGFMMESSCVQVGQEVDHADSIMAYHHLTDSHGPKQDLEMLARTVRAVRKCRVSFVSGSSASKFKHWNKSRVLCWPVLRAPRRLSGSVLW